MVRKNCRSRKMAKTLTHHGTETAVNVSNQPPRGLQMVSIGIGHGSERRMTKFGISVTSCGIIIVPRNTRNSRSRPGKRKRAKPYAASTDVTSVPATVDSETRALFIKKRGKFAARHASA